MKSSLENGLRIFGSPYFDHPKNMNGGETPTKSAGFLAQWASRHYPQTSSPSTVASNIAHSASHHVTQNLKYQLSKFKNKTVNGSGTR
jgi:hypothetical protein